MLMLVPDALLAAATKPLKLPRLHRKYMIIIFCTCHSAPSGVRGSELVLDEANDKISPSGLSIASRSLKGASFNRSDQQ